MIGLCPFYKLSVGEIAHFRVDLQKEMIMDLSSVKALGNAWWNEKTPNEQANWQYAGCVSGEVIVQLTVLFVVFMIF